ncbi:MAG: tRNA (adenosine(37)-N6)-threonylcarbamoyltransferase complex transferase subunit TsaD [Alphaproteobacteria bacterium]
MMNKSVPIVLGIETSCDDTAAAIVTGERRILAEPLLSQIEEHRAYGGVVPEIAARAHLDHLPGLIAGAVEEAGVGFAGLDAVAATGGPGLIGGVHVGVMMAKAIASVHGLPFLAINHLEGHALSARLVDEGVEFPYLLLLVSGGHCQLLRVGGVGNYRRLGTTLDDAVGECFDKVARMLGLGYPGGPAVERAAATGDGARFELPRPMRGREGCDFSFSGLKTAVRLAGEALPPGAFAGNDIADLCASFQAAVVDVLAERCANAMKEFKGKNARPAFVVAGGVAANAAVRSRLETLAGEHGFRFLAPPPRLCTDNAAMIAWAGIERLRLGLTDGLDFKPRPRWPLDAAAG